MKQITFIEGATVALLLAFIATFGADLTTTISLTVTLYIVYLLKRSGKNTGRISTLAAVILFELVMILFNAPLAVLLISHLIMIWLVRCLFFYQSITQALLDSILQSTALSAAAWAATQTGSPFLIAWTFFLVQALFILNQTATRFIQRDCVSSHQRFTRSAIRAEAALRKLYKQ